MIKHIIFDIDGTLADTAKVLIPACTQVSKDYGLPPVSDDVIRQTIDYAYPDFYFELYPHKTKHLMLEYGRKVDALAEAAIWEMGKSILFPGVISMLESLILRRVSLSVTSMADFPYVNAVLTTAGIQHFFDMIAYGEPDEEDAVRNIIFGSPTRWALVGDKPKDMSAARANGILAIAAGFGYVNRHDAAMFDRVLSSPGGILNWVQ